LVYFSGAILVGAALAAAAIKGRRRVAIEGEEKAHPLRGVVQKRATMFSNLADKAGKSSVTHVEMSDVSGGEFV